MCHEAREHNERLPDARWRRWHSGDLARCDGQSGCDQRDRLNNQIFNVTNATDEATAGRDTTEMTMMKRQRTATNSHPTQSGFALSLSMRRAVAPPNHGAAALQHHAEAVSFRGRACSCWFAFLWGVSSDRIKKQREGWGRLGLRWPPFIENTQQSNHSRR